MSHVGAHLSMSNKVSGLSDSQSITEALDEIRRYNGSCLQVFLSHPRQRKKRTIASTSQIKEHLKKHRMRLFVHAPYLINLAQVFDDMAWWVTMLIRDMTLAEKVGAEYVVVHFGQLSPNCVACYPQQYGEKQAKEFGYINMIKAITYVVTHTPKSVKLLLETAAGQGNQLCTSLTELAYFWDTLTGQIKSRLGICIDTCHIFSAGYDIRTKKLAKSYLRKFDSLIGLDHVKLIHLNDSKVDLGAKVDRHERLGQGKIGLEGLMYFAKVAKQRNIPVIMETPGTAYREEIQLINKSTLQETAD